MTVAPPIRGRHRRCRSGGMRGPCPRWVRHQRGTSPLGGGGFFAGRGVWIERVLTDNARAYTQSHA